MADDIFWSEPELSGWRTLKFGTERSWLNFERIGSLLEKVDGSPDPRIVRQSEFNQHAAACGRASANRGTGLTAERPSVSSYLDKNCRGALPRCLHESSNVTMRLWNVAKLTHSQLNPLLLAISLELDFGSFS